MVEAVASAVTHEILRVQFARSKKSRNEGAKRPIQFVYWRYRSVLSGGGDYLAALSIRHLVIGLSRMIITSPLEIDHKGSRLLSGRTER